MNLAVGAKALSKRFGFYPGPLEPMVLLDYLAQKVSADLVIAQRSFTKDELEWLIEFGAVYKNQKRVLDPQDLIHSTDTLRVHFEPRRYAVNESDLQKRIIFSNDDFLIMNKPSGLPMHPTLDNLKENLIHGLRKVTGHNYFVTHRLDVPTSGLVLIAKTPEYQSLFNNLVSQRNLKKFYLARTLKPLQPRLYRHFMKDTVRAPKEVEDVVPSDTNEKWIECLLQIHSCNALKLGGFELGIELLTGRTHQIRAQLSQSGAPIVGDEMYGGISHDEFGLHAVEMIFSCPKTGGYHQYKVPCHWNHLGITLPYNASTVNLK
ncbi:MAG: RluA family pseudouridine synthase [Oligoflexia bacterium]|nr:RluA family pseudouridine synthase [Oligoflexia bacterium]